MKGTLVNGGKQVKVKFNNADADQIMIIIYSIIQQFASHLKVDKRFIMNKIIDLDKTMVKQSKVDKKEAYKLKHQK